MIGTPNGTLQQKLDRKLCIMDYIDRSMWSLIENGTQAGQNATLITAGIQAAVNAAILKRKRIETPGGVYLHNAVTVNGALELEGEGRGTTFIGQVPNVNLWTFNSDNASCVRNLAMYGQNSSTSGSIIQVNGGTGGTFNSYSQIENVTLGESFNGIHFRSAGGWAVKDSYIVDNYGAALLVENQANVDNGDSMVSGCIIANPPNAGYGIKQISSGGLRVINNKGLGFKRFYWLHPVTGVATSIMVATGNSVEGFTEAGFFIDSDGGTLGSILIAANQISVLNVGAKGIVSQDQENLNFSNNIFRVGGNDEDGIVINSGGPFVVMSNVFQANSGNTGTAIKIGASAFGGMIGPQKETGFGTFIDNQSPTTTSHASLGTMADQDADNVVITNGQVTAAAIKAVSVVDKTGSDGSPFLISSSDETNPLQLLMGFSPGKINMQAIEQGVGYRPLVINSAGGNLLLGTATDNNTAKLQVEGPVSSTGPLKVGEYTLGTLPSAATYNGYLIMVTDATGGPKMCRSNGTVWQILNTTTTVS
jgi:hypothetical protein